MSIESRIRQAEEDLEYARANDLHEVAKRTERLLERLRAKAAGQ